MYQMYQSPSLPTKPTTKWFNDPFSWKKSRDDQIVWQVHSKIHRLRMRTREIIKYYSIKFKSTKMARRVWYLWFQAKRFPNRTIQVWVDEKRYPGIWWHIISHHKKKLSRSEWMDTNHHHRINHMVLWICSRTNS